jgi:hypothetical protein
MTRFGLFCLLLVVCASSPATPAAEPEQGAGASPAEFRLQQNYPNPFNPSTEITYTLPRPGIVVLGVYNAIGQRVATLVNQAQTAGTHSVRWSAAGLPSGVYFYRLTARELVATRKMTLTR